MVFNRTFSSYVLDFCSRQRRPNYSLDGAEFNIFTKLLFMTRYLVWYRYERISGNSYCICVILLAFPVKWRKCVIVRKKPLEGVFSALLHYQKYINNFRSCLNIMANIDIKIYTEWKRSKNNDQTWYKKKYICIPITYLCCASYSHPLSYEPLVYNSNKLQRFYIHQASLSSVTNLFVTFFWYL